MAAANAPAGTEERKKPSLEAQIRTWLSHPLLLLVIGALVTGILVPEFTHRWQAQQTAETTKTKVIADVSDAAATALTQLEIDMNPVLNSGVASSNQLNTPQSIAASYNEWTMKSTNVASEIIAYFPGDKIPDHWGNLSGLIHNFFLLTYARNAEMRTQYIHDIRMFFDTHHIATGVDWSALQPDTPWTENYRNNWENLKRQILKVKAQLVTSIMDAATPAF